MMLLDELRFQQQRFGLGGGGPDLDIGDQRDQAGDAGGQLAGSVEIRADALLEAERFADVEQLAAGAAKQIDPRLIREGLLA